MKIDGLIIYIIIPIPVASDISPKKNQPTSLCLFVVQPQVTEKRTLAASGPKMKTRDQIVSVWVSVYKRSTGHIVGQGPKSGFQTQETYMPPTCIPESSVGMECKDLRTTIADQDDTNKESTCFICGGPTATDVWLETL